MNQQTPNNKQPSAMMTHLVRRGVPVLVLLVVLVATYFFWQYGTTSPKFVEAPASQQPIPVQVVVIEKESVPFEPRHLGQTEGSQVVEIRARVAGHLLERTFDEGQLVEKGQKLFQIDPRPFEVTLAQAKAELARAEATQLRADQQLERNQRLIAQNAVSEEEYEQSQVNQRVAVADVEAQKFRIEAIQLDLQYAAIESPITGMIGTAVKDVGSYIAAGPDGLLTTVHQVDPIYVRFFVTEREILRFRKDVADGRLLAPELEESEIELTLSDGSTYPERGRLNFLDIQFDPRTGTSVVRGSVPNADGLLTPGQFVYATTLGMERIDVIRVPQHAVMQSPVGASVYVIDDNNKVESRPITLGEWSGKAFWIVEKGLGPGERVVIDRLMQVRPGAAVVPTVAEPDMDSQAEENDAPNTEIGNSASEEGIPAS